jgi:hypothetical protein
MNKSKIVMVLLTIFVTLPSWFYLLYTILKAINASELTWFIFYIYLPSSVFISILAKVIDKE